MILFGMSGRLESSMRRETLPHGPAGTRLIGLEGIAGGIGVTGEQSAALLVVRKGAGYQGELDNFIDISVYDHAHPLQELVRLYEMHKLYFFKTDPKNLVKIDATLCRELQEIMKDRGSYQGEDTGVFD